MSHSSPQGKSRFKIAIQPDFVQLRADRHQSFSAHWSEYLQQAGHEVCLVDVFAADFFEQIQGCDGFHWWFPPIQFPRDKARLLMQALAHIAPIPTFPAWKDCWHFDDKAAQSYLFRAAGIPIPRTWVFWQDTDALEFSRTAQYPLVIKLKSGFYSQNVRALHNQAEAEYWIKQVFHYGLLSLDRPADSGAIRAKKRVRAALRELIQGHGPDMRGLDFHKDYLLMQEFIPGNDFDTRITVIGNRAFGFRRYNRPEDFRASGSRNADFDPALMELDTVRFAFHVAATLGTQAISMDILRHADKLVVCEVSYYFERPALYACSGHWALAGGLAAGEIEWVEGPMHPEDAILEDFLVRLASKSPGQAGMSCAAGE